MTKSAEKIIPIAVACHEQVKMGFVLQISNTGLAGKPGSHAANRVLMDARGNPCVCQNSVKGLGLQEPGLLASIGAVHVVSLMTRRSQGRS